MLRLAPTASDSSIRTNLNNTVFNIVDQEYLDFIAAPESIQYKNEKIAELNNKVREKTR